jgi:hypothetical protein
MTHTCQKQLKSHNDIRGSESFVFLYDCNNSSATLARYNFTTKILSILLLYLILPLGSLHFQSDGNDFVQQIKNKFVNIVGIICLRNKVQQSVRAVKLGFKSIKFLNEVLNAVEISIMHTKYKIAEYYSQINVLICFNRFGILYFQ